MFKFRKIASVLASAIMVSSTVALAAAANYPSPFIKSGTPDVAVVYGSAQVGGTDLLAAADISTNLQEKLAAQTAVGGSTSTSSSVSGEAAPLFTSGTKLYMNDTLNQVKTSLTDTQLPTVLADGSFSGNVDTTYAQTIDIGFNPSITYARQPTSTDDPNFGLTESTTTGNYIYNASVTFNKAVNLTHADSEGEDLTLFGQKFTIASSTDETKLVLLKTAEKVSLSSDDPSAEVTIGTKKYTIELVSASDTTATVKVIDDTGASETKEINENASKKVNGVTIAITNADENNLKYSASVIAGAEKVTLSATAGSAVTYGEEDTNIDGATVTITGGSTAATKITVSITAKDSDHDALMPGTSMVDPVFGTFKLDFAGLSIPSNSTARESIDITNSGNDKLQVKFQPYYASAAKNIVFMKNWTTTPPGLMLQADDDGHNISVREGKKLYKGDYTIVGNEDEARLIRISYIYNSSTAGTTTSGDKITYVDAFTDESKDMDLGSTDGSATLNVGGKSYTVKYNGSSSTDSNWITINYPDSAGAGSMVAYPTIETKLGAKVAFYKPINITNVGDWDSAGTSLTQVRLPDGDGYTDVAIGVSATAGGGGNITIDSTVINATGGGGANPGKIVTIGQLSYNFTTEGANQTTILLQDPEGNGKNIMTPALIIFEEKDDNTNYEAIVVTPRIGADSTTPLGVSDVIRTWGNDSVWDSLSIQGNSDLKKEADLWGTIITTDSGGNDEKAYISYPDEQVTAEIYFAENAAEITAGETTSGGTVKSLGNVIISDAEASTTGAGKNLIVVGGSCVNTVAASLLGSSTPLCGADFTAKTTVTSGQFLIETFARGTDKVATLVAGYNAADTTAAAKYLRTATIDTIAGKKVVVTSSTSAVVA